MKASRLLDRQMALIAHLTDADVIFGAAAGPTPEPWLAALGPGHLRLEAWFSFTKRVAKIEAVLPRTFKCLGDRLDGTLRAFAAACPPSGIERLSNGRQFHDFLHASWRNSPPDPPYLADLARVEMAYARARAFNADDAAPPRHGHCVRLSPRAALVRCGYDVRPLFETERDDAPPDARDVPLVVTRRDDEPDPRIFEIPAWLFDDLAALEDWTDWDASALSARTCASDMVRDLVARNVLETSP